MSVVIPCHNLSAYLGDAVESALAQTERDIEVRVVDDGSTEDLAAALVPYRHDARLRLLRLDRNQGPAAARNAGIRASDSRFVAFLDADDQWLPGKLEAQLETLRDPAWAGCTSGGFAVFERFARVMDRAGLNQVGDLYSLLLFRNVVGNPSAVLLRRSRLEAAGGFDEALQCHEDHDLWSRLALEHRLAATPALLTIVRRDRRDSLIRDVPRMALASAAFLERRARDEPPPRRQKLERARVVHALRLARMASQSQAQGLALRYSLRGAALALRPVAFGFQLRPALAQLLEALRDAVGMRRRARAGY